MNVTEVYRRCAAQHRHVFTVVTIVTYHTLVRTVSDRRLVSDTPHVIHHDQPGARTVAIANHRSSVPETNNIVN